MACEHEGAATADTLLMSWVSAGHVGGGVVGTPGLWHINQPPDARFAASYQECLSKLFRSQWPPEAFAARVVASSNGMRHCARPICALSRGIC